MLPYNNFGAGGSPPSSHQHAPGAVAFADHQEQGAAVWAVGEGVDDFTGRSCRGKDAFSARRAGEFHQPCALGLELLDVIEVPLQDRKSTRLNSSHVKSR